MTVDRLRDAFPPLGDELPPQRTLERLEILYADEPTRTQRRRSWRALTLVGVGGVLVSGTALAATGVWRPQLGSPDRGTPPSPARAGVPAEQLRDLSILRRPQRDADRSRRVQEALKVLSAEGTDGIHVDAIRVITESPRELVFLVPVERFGDPRNPQRDGLCLVSSSYSDARTLRVGREGRRRTLRLPAGFSYGTSCGATEDLQATGIETGTTSAAGGGLVTNVLRDDISQNRVALVPDGVARVAVRLRGGRRVTVPVRDNVYRFTLREISANLGNTWYDTEGNRLDHRRSRARDPAVP